MVQVHRSLPLALCLALTAACGGVLPPEPPDPMPRASWQPLPSSPPPAAAELRADRSAFLGHVQQRSRSELDRARGFRRQATLAFGAAVAMVALGPALFGWDFATAVPVAMPAAGAGYVLRRRGEQRERCAAALVGMANAFTRKWSDGRLPDANEEWLEYRRDQQTIIVRGPCQEGGI